MLFHARARKLISALLPICFLIPSAAAQSKTLPEPALLQQMASGAAAIFVGSVVAVKPVGPETSGTTGALEISFKVQNGLRGVQDGEVFVLREWGGLWRTSRPFRVGDRVLLFLHPQGKLGFLVLWVESWVASISAAMEWLD